MLLSACAKVPPVPTDHYYRLTEPQVDRIPSGSSLVIAVAPFIGDLVYRDRAIVYSDTDDNRLQHYRYHFWSDSPVRFMQHHTVDYLMARGMAGMVVTSMAIEADLVIHGRIRRFERSLVSGEPRSLVAVRFQVDGKEARSPVLIKDYSAVIVNRGSSVSDAVASFDAAVAEVLEAFVNDLEQLTLVKHAME
jgi:ABC-type uncharacterized transport system auxiliary subunit